MFRANHAAPGATANENVSRCSATPAELRYWMQLLAQHRRQVDAVADRDAGPEAPGQGVATAREQPGIGLADGPTLLMQLPGETPCSESLL
jgi:hypothetical protein